MKDRSDYAFDISKHGAANILQSEAVLPEHFIVDDLTQFTVGMGPANDGVMFHSHTAAWNALVFGEKWW